VRLFTQRGSVYDHALTRLCTVTRGYVKNPDPRPQWPEFICAEGNGHVAIGKEKYFLSADGLLMPSHEGQEPPDARYSGRRNRISREVPMIKWQIAAILGIVFGIAGIGWGYAQQQQAPGFYELRVYTALPGKRDALAERFASRTAAIFARHGITNVGYWIPQESDPELGITAENTFIYIRGYPSKAERDKRLAARAEDPEFAEVVRKAESNPATKLISKVHNIDMVPHGPYTAITLTK
jgi:NIPSNAP